MVGTFRLATNCVYCRGEGGFGFAPWQDPSLAEICTFCIYLPLCAVLEDAETGFEEWVALDQLQEAPEMWPFGL